MNYLGPGAFTLLPLDPESLPDPPPAPPPYRLTPTTRRQKHKSFAIIGEPTSSSPNSRSSSPTGRVSPFKGRGFNPIGSRHASPSISPVPPEDPRATSPNLGAGGNSSRIPKPTAGNKPRKPSSGAIFGEKVTHVNFRGLNRQSSQSLTSLEEKTIRRRPPPSPRKKLKGPAAFKQLSPILGSSPEPSQSLSSPSRIPTKSKSTPPSRLTSPSRDRSRALSRSQSRSKVNQSRDHSPLTMLTKIPVKKYEHVQSKINTFGNKPKVPPKPVIPPLSSDLSDESESPKNKKNSINRTSSRPNLLPKTFMGKNQNYTSDSSVSTEPVESHKPKTVSAKTFGPKVTPKNVPNSTSVGKNSASVANPNSNKPSALKTNQTSKSVNKKELGTPRALKRAPREIDESTDTSPTEGGGKKSSLRGSKIDLTNLDLDDPIPSTIDVVSSTTSTVTKPLKIDTPKFDRAKAVSPMIDGRVLSATSVSHAINKMNDTVLNTQTLIKDSGLQSRLSSAAGAVISVRSEFNEKKGGVYENQDDFKKESPKASEKQEAKDQSKKVDDQSGIKTNAGIILTKTDGKTESPNATAGKTAKVSPNNVNTQFSSIEPASKNIEWQNNHKVASSVPPIINNSTNHVSNNHSNNYVTTIGLGNARAIEREVQNNMNRLLGSMDSSLGDTPINKMSANDRIREARTVIAADVKPIRITVREKPSDVEVQSGNVGPHFSVANGVNERPGLPPPHQQTPPNEEAKEETPPNRCKRFLNSCTKVLTCNKCQCCKKVPKVQESLEEIENTGCFKCLSKKSTKQSKKEQVRINIEDENGQGKKSIWQKLKCCKNRVGDTQSCFPIGKRKESWVERRAGSFLESEVQQKTKFCSKLGCRNFFRRIFCCCCKEKEIPLPATRQESVVSSKKKSLTPMTLPPPEDTKPKIDASLVEHASHMKGAIPVLPVWLAWFCCIMNCIGPGTGTVLSGLFCLCIGIARFSQKDGPKPRIGSFVINLIIGFSQFFTVLFCLVGWGWSIWWGVIMVRVAKKHRKFKHLEHLEETAARPQPLAENQKRDAERGRT